MLVYHLCGAILFLEPFQWTWLNQNNKDPKGHLPLNLKEMRHRYRDGSLFTGVPGVDMTFCQVWKWQPRNANKDACAEHPGSSGAEQRKYLQDLKGIINLVTEERVVNPFRFRAGNNRQWEIMDQEIGKCLQQAPLNQKAMFAEFVHGRIKKASKLLFDVIPRANLFTFSNRSHVDLGKGSTYQGTAKAKSAMNMKMFLSLQA